MFWQREKPHYCKSSEVKNNLGRVNALSYLLGAGGDSVCVWPFQTVFSDHIKIKSLSMMNHVVNGWWDWGGTWEREESNYIWKQKL